ncbi:cobaltochelatase subunit CobN, partial [Methanoregula sp.]|uniref:cobaltochelatase subunit CobN n=1 Tax=Methanoregula sp. TaxID=2052170 RepID=UPI000CCAE45C
DTLLTEYETVHDNPARRHALEHLIRDTIHEINLEKDMHLSASDSFEILKGKAHEALSKIRNTQVIRDVHIFGEIPLGDMRIEFINNIIRFDIGDLCIRRVIAETRGLDFDELFSHQDRFSETFSKSYGALIEELDQQAKSIIRCTLNDPGARLQEVLGLLLTKESEDKLRVIQMRILDINERLEQSREINALFNGMNGGHTPPGPSGFLNRGQDDILPTGRNFYSTDPYRMPTKSAWIVGRNLAESLLQKYQKEEGRLPENVGFFWMAIDLMCSNGEGFAQMFHLLGVEPIWNASGQVRSFRVVPLDKLGRPRIDITVEITSTLRDCYPTSYELLDEAI